MNQAADSTESVPKDLTAHTTGSIINDLASDSIKSVPKDIASDATNFIKDLAGTGPVTKELVADTAGMLFNTFNSFND